MRLVLLVLLLSYPLSAQPDWYPPESPQPYWHVGLSTASQLTSYYVVRDVVFKSRDRSILYSIPFGLLPGLIKEVLDKRKNHYFNIEDMGYDTMGVLLGISYVLVIELHL